MATPGRPFPINSLPGIRRDGTPLLAGNFSDGLWSRFQRGRPRKMGGYRMITNQFAGFARALHVASANNVIHVHYGSGQKLEHLDLSPDGFGGGASDRTPAGLAVDPNRTWMFDEAFDPSTGGGTPMLLAFASPSLDAIDSDVNGPVYYGDLYEDNVLLVPITGANAPNVSGGLVVMHPYTFVYGNDGFVAWSDEGLPLTWRGGDAGDNRIAESKVVFGALVRGGGQAPAGLFWSLNALVRMSYVGAPAVFAFDTISDQTSVLSAHAIIEYDGVFYWPAVDRFLMYSGVVREMKNDMNINWFFDGLNKVHRNKVFATKIPRFGEIWWFYPRGHATECNAAVIYNVREDLWYDTDFPDIRTAAAFAQTFPYPIMAGDKEEANWPGFSLWQHEFGQDKIVDLAHTSAIRSYVITAPISMATSGPFQQGWSGTEGLTSIDRLEPDFNQAGTMTFRTIGRRFPRSPDEVLFESMFDPTTEKVDRIRNQQRIMRLMFESNTLGGFYEMGQPIIHVEQGDVRP
jgi:hypothetical protein